MSSRMFLRAGLFFFLVLTGAAQVVAQTTGNIRGTVTDPSGAAVPGARITVTLIGTDVGRTVPSDTDGGYEFPSLPVGNYRLEVEATGFKKFALKDVNVSIGHVVVINPKLEIGSTAQIVTVEAGAVQVETTSTQLGAVMNDIAIKQLPLNTRDTYQLLQLQPGVQSQLGSNLFYGSDQPGVVSVNGGRGRSNNYMVNGGDANDAFVNLPAIQPSPDTIQEFRVLTNTFDAEFGRNSGAVVDVVTKSGTNNIHGDVYEFFRNKVLNARGFFDSTKPDSKQNQFGFTLGGPLRKDHTFFFGSYEGRRIRKGISSDTVINPTAAERRGDFSANNPGGFGGSLTSSTVATILQERCNSALTPAGQTALAAAVAGTSTPYNSIFPNSQIPVACFDPVALNLFSRFVAPFDSNGTGSIQTVPVARDRGDQVSFRVDHKINAQQQFSTYYYFNDLDQSQPFSNFQAAGANVPGFGNLNATRVQQINLSHTWAIGSSAVNEFRFSYFREGQGKLDHPQRTNLVTNSCAGTAARFCFNGMTDVPIPGVAPNSKLGITPNLGPAREGLPEISVAGGFTIGNNFEGELPQVGNSFQWSDNYSKVVGKHSLKFGADARRVRFDQMLFFEINGFYTFSTGGPNSPGGSNLFPDYFLGLPTSYGQGSAQGENVRGTSVYLFGEDSWKIKPSLTLNYGLRWELNTPIYDRRNRVQTFRPGQADTVYPCQLSGPNAFALGFSPDPNTPAPCSPGTVGQSIFPLGLVVPGDFGVPPGLTQTYFKAFAPRIGLAWSPSWSAGWLGKLFGGPGKSSIRMGYGIFYNPVEQLVLEQFSAEPPFGGSSSLSNSLLQTPFVSQGGAVSPNPFNGVLNPTPGQPVDWSVFRPIVLFGESQPNLHTQYADQYNFTIQRQLKGNILFQIGYVGSQGHHLLASHNIDPGNPQTCVDLQNISAFYGPLLPNGMPNPNANRALAMAYACGTFFEDSSFSLPANSIPRGFTLHLPYGQVSSVSGPTNPAITLVGLRPFSSPFCQPTTGAGCPPDGVPVFASTYAQDTIGNSNYNSLQILVEKHFSRGLQFQGAYTFSKSIDNTSSFEELLNPFNYRLSRGLSLFDARHRFVFSYYWELPVPKHQGFAGKLVNGWALSGILTYQTGFPVRLGISSNSSLSTNDQELLDGAGTDFTSAGQPSVVAPFQTRDPHQAGCAIGTGPTAGPNNPNAPGLPPPCRVVRNQLFDPNRFTLQPLGTIGNAPRSICCASPISQSDVAILKSTPITESTRIEFRAEFFNAWNHTQFFPPDGNFADGADFGRIKHARDPREIQFGLKFIF